MRGSVLSRLDKNAPLSLDSSLDSTRILLGFFLVVLGFVHDPQAHEVPQPGQLTPAETVKLVAFLNIG